jgi:ferredoxin, 2Fe-2S
MAIIVATDRAGKVHRIEAQTGISVMLNLKDVGGLDVAAICGGSCSCATCHVYVDAAWLARLEPQEPGERELVEDTFYPKPNSRLSCQIEFTAALDGLAVTLAPED